MDTTNAVLQDLLAAVPPQVKLLKVTEKKRRYYLTHLLKSIPARKIIKMQLRIMTLLNFSDERYFFAPLTTQVEVVGPFETTGLRNI